MGGGEILLEPVAKVVNCIINSGEIPNTFKEGVITPVYKKQGKPLQDPNSYRRSHRLPTTDRFPSLASCARSSNIYSMTGNY